MRLGNETAESLKRPTDSRSLDISADNSMSKVSTGNQIVITYMDMKIRTLAGLQKSRTLWPKEATRRKGTGSWRENILGQEQSTEL